MVWASLPQFPYVSTARGIHTQSISEHLGSFALCFLASASSAAAPSGKLAAVRMEGIKGEVTVMSRAACFPLSQLRTSTSAGRVWLRSGVYAINSERLENICLTAYIGGLARVARLREQ